MSDEKPREFWVSYEGMPFRKASEYFVEWSETNDCIHVIEYSAYQQLTEQAEKLVEALEKLEAGYCGMFGDNVTSPAMDAYEISPKIISQALAEWRKFKGD